MTNFEQITKSPKVLAQAMSQTSCGNCVASKTCNIASPSPCHEEILNWLKQEVEDE